MFIFLGILAWAWCGFTAAGQDFEVVRSSGAVFGGRLVVGQRAEPRTLNPVTAVDSPSRDIIRRMMGDLISIDRQTQQTVPALARSWRVSGAGLVYTLQLRRGLKFSDGHPFTSADVLFTFQVHLDPKVNSPNRDLLLIGGKPVEVEALGDHEVRVRLPGPYAAAERLFDSIAILPRHLLEKDYREGKLDKAWPVSAAASAVAGLGPFRLKQYAPGDRLVLERNPHYWKRDGSGRSLPYLDELVFRFLPSEEAQILRLASGDIDLSTRLSARNYAALSKEQAASPLELLDLGPGLDVNFLFFNLSSSTPPRSQWFRNGLFRRAVSAAIDRDSIARLVYGGTATPIAGTVSPGNQRWKNQAIRPGKGDPGRARALLVQAGFTWKEGKLRDTTGAAVEFTIAVSASNSERAEMAAMIQHDLSGLGIAARVVPLEFRSLLERVLRSKDYDACVFGIGGGDADPNAEMSMLVSHGNLHLWNLNPGERIEAWEAEIDRLMAAQLREIRYAERRRLYDRVQALVAENLPVIGLVAPNVLVAARKGIGNLRPAVMDHHTLWNAEYLFQGKSSRKQD